MSGFQTQQNELKTRFNSQWVNRTPVDWPNIVFTKPSPPAPWCRFRISGGESARTTIGDRLNNYRNAGIIFIQIFVPEDSGDSYAFELGDIAAAIFRGWCGTNLFCRAPNVKEVGTDASGYYQVLVSVPFVRNELL